MMWQEVQDTDMARALGERAIQAERIEHIESLAASERQAREACHEKNALEAEIFGVKTELAQLKTAEAARACAAEDAFTDGGGVMWDQIKSKAKSSRQQFQKMREAKEEISALKTQLSAYEADPTAESQLVATSPGVNAVASSLELTAARKNVNELEVALEESESLITALASALTAAGGDKAMIDVAARLKDRAGVFNA